MTPITKSRQVTERSSWNTKNLILNGIHAILLAVAFWAHPVYESSPTGTLS